MSQPFFEGFGIEIYERGGKYFIRVDSGGIGSYLQEFEANEQDIKKAQLSEQDAYEVLLALESRTKPRRVE